jgi:hypothetical protein
MGEAGALWPRWEIVGGGVPDSYSSIWARWSVPTQPITMARRL